MNVLIFVCNSWWFNKTCACGVGQPIPDAVFMVTSKPKSKVYNCIEYDNLNIPPPLLKSKREVPRGVRNSKVRRVSFKILHRSPQWSNMPLWYLIHINQAQLHTKGTAGSLGNDNLKTVLITMNYAQKYVLSVTFLIKVFVNKGSSASFQIVGMIYLQCMLLSARILRFHGDLSFLGTTHAYINTTVFLKAEPGRGYRSVRIQEN